MFVSGFWATLLLFTQIQKYNRTRLLLAMFMAMLALLYYAHCVFFNEFLPLIPVADTIYSFTTLASYPGLYVFLVSITSSGQRLRQSWVLFLPAMLLGCVVWVLYALMTPEQTALFIDRCLYGGVYGGFTGVVHYQAIAHLVIKIGFAISIVLAMVAGTRRLLAYDRHIKSVYSNIEGKTLFFYKVFFYLFILTSVASFVFNIIGRYNFDSTITALTLPSIVFSILIYFLGLLGLHRSFTFENIEPEFKEEEPQAAPQATEKSVNAAELASRIERLMLEQQLHLQPNLKISDLASRLCTNRLYISQAINSVMHLTFSDYINKMRISHAARLIATDPSKPIADVAFESGFASMNSFYRNFRNFQGCSPKAYATKNQN